MMEIVAYCHAAYISLCLCFFQASPRSGTLYLQWDEAAQRVRIRGEAVTVMVGNILV